MDRLNWNNIWIWVQYVAIGWILVLCVNLLSAYASTPVLELSEFRTHSRLSLKLDSSIKTEFEQVSDQKVHGFQVTLHGMGLEDLGPAVRELSQSLEAAPRLGSLSVRSSGDRIVLQGEWKFPTGRRTPAKKEMKTFHFRDQESGSWVLDFWNVESPTLEEVEKASKRDARRKMLAESEARALARRKERELQDRLRAESQDLTKFCKDPWTEDDVFLPMLPAHETYDFSKTISSDLPDRHYRYHLPRGAAAKSQPETRLVLLAHDLYQRGDYALVLKTLEFFVKDFPKSVHLAELEFLKANTYLKLGLEDKSYRTLEEIFQKRPGSGVGLYAGSFLAAKYFREQKYILSLETFNKLARAHLNHPDQWIYRMGVAESLYHLRQAERAAAEFESISQKAPLKSAQFQAALRIGNAHLLRRQYDQALAAYFKVSRDYPAEARQEASLHLNRAESLFGLGQLDRALQAYQDFSTKFPASPIGWRASLRVGEILGRIPNRMADARTSLRDVINRYPLSPGAVLARGRLAPCEDHGGMSLEVATKFLQTDWENFSAPDSVVMERFTDLRALTHVKALLSYGALESAIRVGLLELDRTTKYGTRHRIERLLHRGFRAHLLAMLEAGKTFEALKFYEVHAHKFQNSSKSLRALEDLLEPDYLLKLSRGASDLGMGDLASRLAREYDRSLAEIEKAREHISFETGRDVATIDLKQSKAGHMKGKLQDARGELALEEALRRSERAYTEAKADWVKFRSRQTGDSTKAGISRIQENLREVVEESPFSYGREVILALLAEREAQLTDALTHAARSELLMTRHIPKQSLEHKRVQAWIGQLQSQAGNLRVATSILEAVSQMPETLESNPIVARELDTLGIPKTPSLGELLLARGLLEQKLKRFSTAALTFELMIEKELGGNRARYEYFRSLEESRAKPEKIQAALRALAESSTDDFWRQLARRKLEERR